MKKVVIIALLLCASTTYASISRRPFSGSTAFTSGTLSGYWTFDSLESDKGGIVAVNGGTSTRIQDMFSNAQDFAGSATTDSISIPNGTLFDASTMKTICFWFKVNSTPPVGGDFILDDSNTNSGATNFVRLGLSNAMVLNYRIVGSATTFVANDSAALSLNRWYHWCGTHNGNGSTLIQYVDGVATGAGTSVTEAIGDNTINLFIGRLSTSHGGTGFEPDITIDDLVVMNRQLSSSDILDLASTKPDFTTFGIGNGRVVIGNGQVKVR